MIYPHDVYAKTRRSKGITSADKAKVILGVMLVANIIFTFVTAGVFAAFGVPLAVVIVVQVVLYLFLSLQIFRYTVFREQDRDTTEADLFAPYYKIRAGTQRVKTHATSYELFELDDNSFMTCVQLTFGMNNALRSKKTEEFLNFVQDITHENRLSCRFIVMDEAFTESAEATAMLEKANNVTDPRLRNTQLMICNEILNFTDRVGTVPSIYIMLYARSNFYKDNIEDVMNTIFSKFKLTKEELAIRNMNALDITQLLKMFKRFYGMDAIDLSLSKLQQNITQSDVLKSITLYRVISKDGKTYTNDVFKNIQTSVKYFK